VRRFDNAGVMKRKPFVSGIIFLVEVMCLNWNIRSTAPAVYLSVTIQRRLGKVFEVDGNSFREMVRTERDTNDTLA